MFYFALYPLKCIFICFFIVYFLYRGNKKERGSVNMLLDYFPVLMVMVMVSVMVIVALFASWILSPKNPYSRKLGAWECGFEPVGDASGGHFRIHYFLVAILFIFFDVETLFLFPWAVIINDKSLSLIVFIEMVVFLVVLSVGLVYAWGKGALDWFK